MGEISVQLQLDLAWIDFCCERRELNSRAHVITMDDDIRTTDAQSSIDWASRTVSQTVFHATRASRVGIGITKVPGEQAFPRFILNSRAFWAFYHDRLPQDQQKSFKPQGCLYQPAAPMDTYFDETIRAWSNLDQSSKSEYFRESRKVLDRISVSLPASWCLFSSPRSQYEVDSKMRCLSLNPSDPSSSPRVETPMSPSVYQLEESVANCVKILGRLRQVLEVGYNKGADTSQWIESVDHVSSHAEPAKTIIGIVGNTGAGKSSIINALLDEERLLPTSCMRACTAVVTEISHNDKGTDYLGQIEFVDAPAWKSELEILFKDLSEGNLSWGRTNEDGQAGIAFAKIKAVYPGLAKADLSESSVAELMRHPNVYNLLGSCRYVCESDPVSFYNSLKAYVDSKEKKGTQEATKQASDEQKMDYWPLIRVVRLKVPASVLSTGAVIVDLPGVHDSNPARAAVSQNYIKQCTGIWICAPITRAVDDKAAKSLLGETFKRQLQMDGTYGAVSFICTKTDDITLIEAEELLCGDEELTSLRCRSD